MPSEENLLAIQNDIDINKDGMMSKRELYIFAMRLLNFVQDVQDEINLSNLKRMN